MPAGLKEEILARYVSIHAFCKAHPELSRGTVYQMVSGRYGGNFANQARKIRAALAGSGGIPQAAAASPEPGQICEALQEIRCQNCRKLNRRECPICRDQTSREANMLHEKLYGRSLV